MSFVAETCEFAMADQAAQEEILRGAAVRTPELFRDNVRELTIFMSDQIPMWLKLKPGAQVYAEWQTRRGKYERNFGARSGGSTPQAAGSAQAADGERIEGAGGRR